MTRVPFAGSIKTGLLATGWYANRLEQDAFPGVLTLCYHGLRRLPKQGAGADRTFGGGMSGESLDNVRVLTGHSARACPANA